MRIPHQTSNGQGQIVNLLLALLLTVLMGGCAARPGNESLVPTAGAGPEDKLVTMFVATDRAPDDVGETEYGSDRAALRFEELTVSVPKDHQAGKVEWTSGSAKDPSKSFVVQRRRHLDGKTFRQQLASRIGADGTAAVFVHGYNYTLPEAVFRLAQLAADSKNAAVPILFSWPSEAAVTGYVADRDGVAYARDDLVQVLELVASIQVKGKNLLGAHSMGGWLVMEALRQLRLQHRDNVIARYEVVLAAPDIDIDVFRRQLAVIGPLSPPLGILVSKDDRALAVSSTLAGGRQRVGAIDVDDPALEKIATQHGLRIVDISSVEPGDSARHDRFVTFSALQSRHRTGNRATKSLRRAGAFVFNAAGAALSSPFTLAGQAISGQ